MLSKSQNVFYRTAEYFRPNISNNLGSINNKRPKLFNNVKVLKPASEKKKYLIFNNNNVINHH